MRRWNTALAALVLTTAGLTVTTASAAPAASVPTASVPAAAAQAAAVCPTGWGSLTKSVTETSYKPLTNVRTGRHDCFDRMVLDVPGAGSKPIGYRVGYVDTLYQDGSGNPVTVRGGAVIEVRAAAPSYDPATGKATYPARAGKRLPGVDVTGYRTFRDTRFAGSFEGDTQIGLGVRARLPFRVLRLPDKLVIDVAHSWGKKS
ncbi:AMIN-like domain-containing (lipo)protein [Streptomyces sp. HB2AG]|uniref:AMIN-like domain-containing (lipo)protein n=1 Tax=Streptomyces sp. HB2AG TaxID=2983400 RepID=UPI0022AA4E36|nr:hypothetical protein [Streptomyces sp. HB2AG]MCZ2528068.1 hypothetical protein [Streptomyces sp. HB2AG]